MIGQNLDGQPNSPYFAASSAACTALFALLAMAGDMGGAFGPSVVGYFSQHAGDNLQAGLLTGCIFPLIMLATLIAMKKMTPEG